MSLGRLALASWAVGFLATCALAVGAPTEQYLQFAEKIEPLPPTPTGDGHLGQLESGVFVQLRFLVPKEPPLAYLLNLGNIVGYSGKGTSYQLILRRDGEDGPVIHEGPVIPIGDNWNASNRNPINLTDVITPEDCGRGYVDIFATGIIEGDGWTVYRHNPGHREITASVTKSTPELRRLMDNLEAMRQRKVAIMPMPQDLVLEEGDLTLTERSRIVLADEPLPPGGRFTADDLAEQIRDRAGLDLEIVRASKPRAGDLVLSTVSGDDIAKLGTRVTLKECPPGAYVVVVNGAARAYALEDEGLFYAAQTLAQLVDSQGRMPHCQVADWPAYPIRGLQYDVARGQTVEVEWWKRLIRELGRCKLNMLEIYGEDDYRFERYPFLGREGTFTPEKAKELSAYAHRYHMELVPQFESLGHASAVLRHEELADLREAGGSWVFCTSNPKVWEFLDNVYAELCEQFPYSHYIHVGGDEFESGFGKCEKCRAKIAEAGIGGLYAEHMNKLNQLCKKHGRTMLFWPSHRGPTDELSYMSVKYIDLLEKDCIPTEWIYHGPQQYPQIQQYQDLGYEDVWVSPAVVCFSRIWPDYRTTYRGISGFLQAGHERGCRGSMTTTWEWRHGGIVTNSLPGMFYAAECAWSLGRMPVSDFERRYAQHWLGITTPDAGERLHEALIEPWPRTGPASICYDSRLITNAFWASPKTALRDFALKDGRVARAASDIIKANADALAQVAFFKENATRNADLLPYAELAFEMYQYAAQKLTVMQEATKLYARAQDLTAKDRPAAADALTQAAGGIRNLAADLESLAWHYGQAVQQVGADASDVERMNKQRAALRELVEQLEGLAEQVRAGEIDKLPPGATYGFLRGNFVKVGAWQPEQMSEEGCQIRIDLAEHLTAAGDFTIEWEYTRGAHGVHIHRTALLVNGEQVAVDEHEGWAGGGSHENSYQLTLEEFTPGAKYEIVGDLTSSGGTDSRGDVWLITEPE